MRTAPSRFGTAIVVITAITLGGLLSACGSSSKSSTKTTKTTSSAAGQSTTTQAASDVVVTVKKDPKLGNVLADSKGLTLYTLTSNGKAVACTGPASPCGRCVAMFFFFFFFFFFFVIVDSYSSHLRIAPLNSVTIRKHQ